MAISTELPQPVVFGQHSAIAYEQYLGQRYFPALDSVRALSIFAVVFFHAAPTLQWLNGNQGVNFFFVLSGFLITTLLLREEDARGHVDLAAFYIRRIFRLLPLYYLTLTLYCVLLLGLRIQPDRAEFFRWALPYYALYFPEYIHLNGGGPFSHSWSLGIEEKFYAIWPWLCFAVIGARARARPVVLLGLICVILSLPASVDWTKYVQPYGPILVGCLIAVLLHRRDFYDKLRPIGSRPGLFLALAFATILLDGHRASLFVAAGCATALISLVLAPERGTPTTRLLGASVVVFVGQRAYEIYLFHQVVLNALRPMIPVVSEPLRGLVLAAVGFGASVLVATVAHAVVGQPLVRWGRKIAGRLAYSGPAWAGQGRPSSPLT